MTVASNTAMEKVRTWLQESGGGYVADAMKATKVDRSQSSTILRQLIDEGLCKLEKRTEFDKGQNRTKNFYIYTPKVVVPTSLLIGDDAARVRAFLKHCPEARSDYRAFGGYIDFEPPTNVKKLPVKRKGLKISAMDVFDRAA
jgi:hypothetical protein